MSRGVTVHDGITEWDGYALFDRDNVLSSSVMYENLNTAKAHASEGDDVWYVTLTKKGKVNDNSTEPI
jgi:hypothetical protein